MPYQDHRRKARQSVTCAVITVSDTRTEETDKSGQLIRELLEAQGHKVAHYAITKDEPDNIRAQIKQLAADEKCHVVLLNGGTGLAPRDTTYEAIDALLEKRLTGFGELFRYLSYEEIGSGAMASRATAGTYGKLLIFSMPGSTPAVRLAMEKLILPELAHLVWLMQAS